MKNLTTQVCLNLHFPSPHPVTASVFSTSLSSFRQSNNYSLSIFYCSENMKFQNWSVDLLVNTSESLLVFLKIRKSCDLFLYSLEIRESFTVIYFSCPCKPNEMKNNCYFIHLLVVLKTCISLQ